MAGDRFSERKKLLILSIILFTFVLSLSFAAQAYDLGNNYFITIEQPKDTNGLGFFKIGTPLDADVNITFNYPIPLSPGEANLTATIYNRSGSEMETSTISLGDIIKNGDIYGNPIVSGDPPMYDFREIFFDYTLNLSYDNVSKKGIEFDFSYDRDMENTQMNDTDNLQIQVSTNGDFKYGLRHQSTTSYWDIKTPPRFITLSAQDDANLWTYLYSPTSKSVTFYVRGLEEKRLDIDDSATVYIEEPVTNKIIAQSPTFTVTGDYTYLFEGGRVYKLRIHLDDTGENSHVEAQIKSPVVTNIQDIWTVINSQPFTAYLNNEFWKVRRRQSVLGPDDQPLENYCGGPADFNVEGSTVINSVDCDDNEKIIEALKDIEDLSDYKLTHSTNGGLYFRPTEVEKANDTTYHFSTVVKSNQDLSIKYIVLVNYGMRICVDGDCGGKGFSIGCPTAAQCQGSSFYNTNAETLTIPTGYHKIDVYLFCRNGDNCMLNMKALTKNGEAPEIFFKDNFDQIGKPSDTSTLGTNPEIIDSSKIVSVSERDGLVDVGRPEPQYFETGLYRNPVPTPTDVSIGSENIQLAFRLACGQQIYQPCVGMGWGACTTDKNGWIKERILHKNYVKNSNNFKFIDMDSDGQEDDVEIIIEPFDHHSLDASKTSTIPDQGFHHARDSYSNKAIGGIYECRSGSSDWKCGVDDRYEPVGALKSFKCCLLRFTSDPNKELNASWDGLTKIKDEWVGLIRIKDYKESDDASSGIIYMINYLPYAGAENTSYFYNNGDYANGWSDFSMFDERPKLCAYVTEKVAPLQYVEIDFNNTKSCNKETLSGDCCYCDPNSACTLNCKNIYDEIDDFGNVLIKRDSIKGSSFTLPFATMGTDWYLENIKVSAIVESSNRGNVSMDVINTSSVTRWKARAELKSDAQKMLQENNYTISVNLFHDFGFNVSEETGVYFINFTLDYINVSRKNYSDGSYGDWNIYINQYTYDDYPSSVRNLYLSPYKPQNIDVKKIYFSGEENEIVSFSGESNMPSPSKTISFAQDVVTYLCPPTQTETCACMDSYTPSIDDNNEFLFPHCRDSDNNFLCGGISKTLQYADDCSCPDGFVPEERGLFGVSGSGYKYCIDADNELICNTIKSTSNNPNDCNCKCPDDFEIEVVEIGNSYFCGCYISYPLITHSLPNGIVRHESVELGVLTNEDATCKYSTEDVGFEAMPNTMPSNNDKTHKSTIHGLTEGLNTFFVRCQDFFGNAMTSSYLITFTVALGAGDISTPCDDITEESSCSGCYCTNGIALWNSKRNSGVGQCLCTENDNVCEDDDDCEEARNGNGAYPYCDTDYNMCYSPQHRFDDIDFDDEDGTNINFTAAECTVPGAETRFYYDFENHPDTYDDFGRCEPDGTCPDGGICVYGDGIEGECILPRGGCSLGLQVCGGPSGLEYKWLYAESENEVVYEKEEVCNGIDDDCNGWIDDTVNITNIFRISLELANQGIRRTAREITQCECFNGLPSQEEVCDSIDNDCDGIIDNDRKHVLMNNCTKNVTNVLDLGYSPLGFTLYGFAYYTYHNASITCKITNETIGYTQNLTVNPCTEKVYECMNSSRYHYVITYDNVTDIYNFSNKIWNNYSYCAEKHYDPHICIPLETQTFHVPGELCACEFYGEIFDPFNPSKLSDPYTAWITGLDTPTEPICNGLDDNCDALLDNTEYPELCGCYGITNRTIRDEKWLMEDVNCTGRDENCDDAVNDGAEFCNCSQTQNPLAPNSTRIKELLISNELCNGWDDNCNQEIDEDFPVNTSCGGTNVSRCYGGIYVCNATGYNALCNTTTDISEITTNGGVFGVWASSDLRIPEECNGVDDDCNGTVDDTEYSQLCNCYNYEYLWEIQDIWANNTDDNCNGIDDDCNSGIDDNSTNCACRGKTESEVMQIKTVNETCDGIDNNCNGFADETFANIGKMCGFGACSNGVMVCDVYGLRTVCNTTVDSADTYNGIAADFASTEICDLIGDEDCDGSIDEGCACTPQGITKICGYSPELVYNNRGHVDSICDNIRSQLRNMVSKSSSPGDMKYRRTINIQNSNSYDVKDYPVRVDLLVIGSSKLRSDFGDVRVQDAIGNELPWRSDGGSIVFKSNLLSSGNNAYTMYYGSPVRTYSEKSMTEIYGLERYQETGMLCDFNYNTQCNKGNMVPKASDVSVKSNGKYEAAVEFNSINNTLRYASSGNINLNRGTVEMWIKTSNDGTLFHLPADSGSIKVEISSGSISLIRDSASVASGGSVSDSQWHYVAFVWDNLQGMDLYIDGNNIGSSTNTWTTSNIGTDIYIGSGEGSSDVYEGLIDELRISKIMLTAGDVKADARQLGGSISPSLANEEDMGSVGSGSGEMTDSELYYECLERLEDPASAADNSDNENSILSLCTSMVTCNSDFSIESSSICKVGVQNCGSSGWSECSGNVVPRDEICNRMDDDCNGIIDDFLYAQDTCRCYNGGSPSPEECNGIDDNCNAQIDDGFGGRCACSNGQKAQGDEPRICNGIDDNCNGIIDENVTNCACADATFANINQLVGSETCNGIDDDCDGEIDEDFPNVGNTCGGDEKSVCYGGYYICKADGTSVVCSTTTANVSLLDNTTSVDLRVDEICNGMDDDCDGERDEGIPRCACADGAQNAGGYEPKICNGIDDNCDGKIDEGVLKCPCADKTLEEVEGFIKPDLTCDDIDNDCNGIIDDQFPTLGETCGGNARSACYGGYYVCNMDENSIVCNTMTPPEDSLTGNSIDRRSEESCNGIDDDCNEIIDDLAGSNSQRYCSCYNGVRFPGELPERCNGIDEDCDGMIDNNVAMCGCSGVSTLISNYELTRIIDNKRSSSEICNNIDDNCDGGIDDSLGDSCYCTGGYNGTASGRPEFCNAVDDNCNGVIDDIPKPYTCACYEGARQAGELPEICNGIDDDCNGIVDEEYPEKGADCGVGVCSGGMYECSETNQSTICSGDKRAIAAALEYPNYCDILDNNCNIAIDEGCGANATISTTNRSCGSSIGECSEGLQLLVGGKWGPCMTIGKYKLQGPEIETCDTLDNDCDGITDNIGGKKSVGETRCGCYDGGQPSNEDCNGIDDNCDGTIDNIDGKTSVEATKCGCYDNEYGQGAGVERCNGIDDDCDGIVDNVKEEESVEDTKCGCYGGLDPMVERCNGIDDDCDTKIDEDFAELGNECGVGYCSGMYICSEDGTKTICNGNTPTTEICDSIDNDCDGKIDEGCYGDELTSCENSIKDGREEGIDCGGPCPNECVGTYGPSATDDLNTKKETIKSTWFTIFLIMIVLIIGIGIALQFGLKTK